MDKLKREDVKLIVFDFDGVMTDNRALVDENGVESVFVSRADGQGVAILKEKGVAMVILSSEANKVVSKRAQKLGLPVIQGVEKKDVVLSDYCVSNGISFDKVMYVGNDVNDVEAMKLCEHVVVPSDAHQSAKACAGIVLETRGGYGVVRELADLIE